ncbi:peptidylprolyl isomerase [Bremerella cremea]|uniref:peptidylprolyl isomerase n=1 Tax=Bremerella cremea TaxID=1031537 RepID=UPI00131434FB|nr:peptidyl-prolyl cis-trans isomerase [Bremerella cremea]
MVLPSAANAQFGWPSRWNPWKQEATAEATPPDPFAERRGAGQPQYRMANVPARPTQTQPTGYSPPNSQAYGQGTMGSNMGMAPPAGAGYPAAYPAAVSQGATYPAQTNSYPATGVYPSTGNNSAYGYEPAAGQFSGYSAPQNQMPAANDAPAMPASYPNTQMVSPGYSAPAEVAHVANLPQQTPAVDENDLFKPARIVAIVNGEPILAGDVLGPVNQIIKQKLESLTEEQLASVREDDIEKFKEQALKQMLPGMIDVKIVYLEFLRNVPQDRRADMQQMLDKNYYEHQLESDLKEAGVQSRAEFDMKLRETGSSLEKKKQRYVEQVVAYQQIQRHVRSDEEVTHQQMLDFYSEHSSDYEKPARAKWEQLMVKFSEFPNRQAAWEAMAAMGNRVLRGAPLDAVAKRESQGIRASRGGQYDWTSKGSLKNETVDQAIFTLPVGELSPIIESQEGFHIVRVVEREEEGMVPFTEAQVEIKEQIKKQRKQKATEAYIQEVKAKAQVWTIFDEENQNTPPR